MAKRRKKDELGIGGMALLVLVIISVSAYLIIPALIILPIYLLVSKYARKARAAVKEHIADIDQMDGHAFEEFTARLLAGIGYQNVVVTKASGDYGVDVVAEKDGVRWAFQCKRYNGSLGLKPIQEVYAGAKKYGAAKAVVVTNSSFTKNAQQLARGIGVELWDRGRLISAMESVEKERLKQEKAEREKAERRREKLAALLCRAKKALPAHEDEYDMTKDRCDPEYDMTKD